VQELLKDSRVDPSAQSNFALRYACMNGYLDIAREIIHHSKFHYNEQDLHLISLATMCGHNEIAIELQQLFGRDRT